MKFLYISVIEPMLFTEYTLYCYDFIQQMRFKGELNVTHNIGNPDSHMLSLPNQT